jgi:PAS domain S-box-containing protein
MNTTDDDQDWLNHQVRMAAADMLQVLFASSRISVVTFDSKGVIVGVNPQTAGLGGRPIDRYQGVSLRDHPVLRRLGFSAELARVLDGDTVEITDTRWVTLFSGEERWVDVLAGPVVMEGRVVGGVAYLVDSTESHQAAEAEAAKRRRARELIAFVTRDVRQLVSEHEAMTAELREMLEDLLHFLRIESYEPAVERLALDETLARIACVAAEEVAVFADPRLLRRILSNINQFRLRLGGGDWSVKRHDGRVQLQCLLRSAILSRELLAANRTTTAEADGADSSLAAARWMAELMGGMLSVDGHTLILDLPAADPLLVELAEAEV